jgi:HSP20 family molecular chaperone IbpA
MDPCGPTEILHDISFLQREEIGISIQEKNCTVSIENPSSDGEGCGSRLRKNFLKGAMERSRAMPA